MSTELNARRYEAMRAVVASNSLSAQLEAKMDFSPEFQGMRDTETSDADEGVKMGYFDQMHDAAIKLVEGHIAGSSE